MLEEIERPEAIGVTQITCGEFRDLVKQLTDGLPMDEDGESRMLNLQGVLVSQAPSTEHEGGTDYSATFSSTVSPVEGIQYAVDTEYRITQNNDGGFFSEREVRSEDTSPREVTPLSVDAEAQQLIDREARNAAISDEDRDKKAAEAFNALEQSIVRRMEEGMFGLNSVSEQELQQVIQQIKTLTENPEH